jgi:hypothetical protein
LGDRLPARRRRIRKCVAHRTRSLLAFIDADLPSGLVINRMRFMSGKHGRPGSMRTRELAAEMSQASALITRADMAVLVEQHGVAPREIEIFQMIGIARIARTTDSELYEPDCSGALAFITPVLAHQPMSPESRWPEGYVRFGNILDLVAWDDGVPEAWALRIGNATWFGSVSTQFLDSEPVAIRRSPLVQGIVVLEGTATS